MTESAQLTGVVPPLVTPLTPSYEVDTASLARLVQYQLAGGVSGVFVLGTSGEGTFLTDEQRQVVLETTVAEVAGQVPVLAGVIDTSTNRVSAHVSAALKAGVDGVVPGLGNVDPAGYVRLYNAAVAGDAATAREEQDRLFRLFDIIKVADRSRMGASSAALGAFKGGLYLLGVIDCPVTAYPSIALNDGEIAAIRPLLDRAGLH